MNLLLSNDDGIDAPGLASLEAALAPLGLLWTLAPEKERSAQSHAFTLHKPIRARPAGVRRYAISGTPADCVYLGLQHIVQPAPSVVVSGINRGANLGGDVYYSGTVGAAREACIHGCAAISVSLHCGGAGPHHFDTAAHFAARVVRQVMKIGLPTGIHLNLNVPDLPLAAVRGLRACSLGRHDYAKKVVEQRDPRGIPYYWIGGPHESFSGAEGSDGLSCAAGWATLTPLAIDLTDSAALGRLREWTDA